MEDSFKKLIYSGVGFISLAAKNLDKAIKDMQEKGNLSDEEGQRIFNDFKEEAGKTGEELEKDMKLAVEKMLDKMDIAKKQELEELKNRVKALEEKSTIEQRLAALEQEKKSADQ